MVSFKNSHNVYNGQRARAASPTRGIPSTAELSRRRREFVFRATWAVLENGLRAFQTCCEMFPPPEQMRLSEAHCARACRDIPPSGADIGLPSPSDVSRPPQRSERFKYVKYPSEPPPSLSYVTKQLHVPTDCLRWIKARLAPPPDHRDEEYGPV